MRAGDAASATVPRGAAGTQAADPLAPLAGPEGRSIVLVGAGGCGMRGLARFFLAAGWEVHGQDARGFALDDPLVLQGLKPLEPGAAPPAVSWAVRSAAVPDADSSWRAAGEAAGREANYAQMLGEISRLRPVLAVAGSHGKTTCTAWIAYGLRRAGVPAGWLVGAEVAQLGTSAEWGSPEAPLVVESCEYARSFHALRPQQVALVNVDAEHPDTYPGGLPEVLEAFRVFLGGVPDEGTVWAGPETPQLADATQAAWQDCAELPADWEVGLPGAHNRRNAALVAGVLAGLGLSEQEVREALAGFRGAARRLETVAELEDGALVVSDYAHHPVEVAATLQAARERWPERRLVAVFQPHQAQRFHAYREQFAPSLDRADALLLLEIYRTRDPEELQASVAELLPELERRGADRLADARLAAADGTRPLVAVRSLDEGREQLAQMRRPGDLVLCLGAGDVDAFARSLA